MTIGIHGGGGGASLEEPVDVTGPQTDAEARAAQTISGLIDGNGDTVTLPLNGATGVTALFPDATTLDGSVVFEASYDEGTSWDQIQANAHFSWDTINRITGGGNPSNYVWHLALGGGETHVRVRCTAYTSGSVTVTLTGTYTTPTTIQNAMFASAGGNIPMAGVLIGGRADNGFTQARTAAVRGDDDGKNNQALVVRNMSGCFRVDGAMTGANDFGVGIGGIDDGNVYQFAEVRDADPATDVIGIVVRNIPSGTQVVGDGGSSLTVDNATLSVVGGGVEATALRVTLASDSTGVVSVDDNGGALTVDGAVTANAGTNLNTSALNLEATQADVRTALQIIDDWDESDRAKVNPIAGQVGVQGGAGTVTALTQRIAVATDANVVSTKTALTASSPTAASVGVASAQAVASNANRRGLVLVNTSSNTISLGLGAAAVLSSGITLLSGASWTMNEFTFTTAAVNAIASGASSNLSIQEFT